MKKPIYLLALICAVILTSCSGNSSTSKILEAIPADADLVAVGDFKTIIESAGGSIDKSKIKLPSSILDNLSSREASEFDDFNDKLAQSGVSVDIAAVTMQFKGNHPTVIVMLDDTKEFKSFIEDEGFREKDEEDGVTYYSKRTYEGYTSEYDRLSYIAVKGDYAYIIQDVWAGSDFKPMRELNKMFDRIQEKTFDKNPVSSYITEGNAGGLAMKLPRELRSELRSAGVSSEILDFYEGYFCMNASLDGDKASVNLKLFNEYGSEKNIKDLGNLCDLNAKISKKALSYMGEKDFFVAAFAAKDYKWSKILEPLTEGNMLSRSDKAAMVMVSSYLRQIDGTVAVGLGLTNGMTSFFKIDHGKNVLEEFSMTAVVETADGKAKSIMSDLKNLMETAGLRYEDTKNGFELTIPGEAGAFYGECDDNFLVFANHPIKSDGKNPVVKAVDFTDYMSAAGVCIDKGNPLFQDLGIDYDLVGKITTNVKKCESNMTVELKGGKDSGIIAKMIKIGVEIAKNGDDIERRFDPYYRDYNYSDDYDYAEEVEAIEEYGWEDGDSVAVEEAGYYYE